MGTLNQGRKIMSQEPINKHHNYKLSIFEDEISIFVKGETFRYGFDKRSGLISHLEVLGDDFLRGTGSHMPDIYVSDSRDPRDSFYSAEYEDESECDVISANPYEVHIRTHGIYHDPSGKTFPIRYRITYEIQMDGTIFVIIDNKAHDECVIRWLCISKGLLNPSLCKYFSYLADQSKVDKTDEYTFKKLPLDVKEDQDLFNGRFIPWFWIGNDRTGIEICLWDVAHHRYGATQVAGNMIDPIGEVGSNTYCVKKRTPGGVLWEIFSLRNIQTPVKDGWEQVNYFTVSVTPPKNYKTEFSALRPYFVGPYDYDTSYKYPSNGEIEELSQKGYNLIIGGANWRPGEYIPDDESEMRRFISACHENDMKVIPNVPSMELSEDTEVFKDHGPEWRIEPVVEYEYKTNLMCPGAEEWREHWMQQVDRIVENYDFDGLYLDFWYDKLACRNPRHGCQRRYMRPTFPWMRDMFKHALAKSKSKNPDSIVVANTDILPISMICSWLDLRSVGKSQDIRDVDEIIRRSFYSSRRLGCNSIMWVDSEREIDQQLVSLSLLYMTPIILTKERSQGELDLVLPYWNVLRLFRVSESHWYPGFMAEPKIGVASTNNPDIKVNVHIHDAILLTVVNVSPEEINSTISLMNHAELGLQSDEKYVVYEPIAQSFIGENKEWSQNELKAIDITIPGYGARLFYVCEYDKDPRAIFNLDDNQV
jgi:hypothetical protein